MQPSITVRPLQYDDITAVTRWMMAIPLWQRYDLTAEKIQDELKQALEADDILLTADSGDDCRACCLAWAMPRAVFGRSAYLKRFAVAESSAGRGVGSALLTATEQRVAQSHNDMMLLVSDFNHGAQRFYRRHGYVQIGALPGYAIPDITELIFWKRLKTTL
ncbi:MAG: GNAT family N-acetyltransferase [Chloroflexi bacterium]|nr:MAG: GNAT family N-acetyltransferase [Chloroflexota bacterium]